MSINLIFISKGPEMFFKKSRFISEVLFRNNLIICTKCEIPVMNFHGAPASWLIQNNHLFSRQSERYVSFVSLHISLSEKDSMTVGRVWHFMWHNQGQNHDNNHYYKGRRRSIITITITRSSRLIVPSLAEITFTYLLDSLDWLRFSTVPSPRLRLVNAGSFRQHWMILWLIRVKSEHLRRDWEIVNALTFHLHVNLANVYSRVRYTWKLPSVCDIIRITFAVRWVVGSKRTTKAILTIEMQSLNLSL